MRRVGRAPGLGVWRAHRTSAWRRGRTLSGTAVKSFQLSPALLTAREPGPQPPPRSTHAPRTPHAPLTLHPRPMLHLHATHAAGSTHALRSTHRSTLAPRSLGAWQQPSCVYGISLSWEVPWIRKWQPTPVLFPGEFHGQRWQRATIERLTYTYTIPFFSQRAPLKHLDQAARSLLFATEIKDSLFL